MRGAEGTASAELIRDSARLRELGEAWRELAVAQGNAFVTPEWLWAWERHYGSAHELMVVVVREPSGAVRGLLPLVVDAGRPRTGRFAASSLGDHFEPVAAAGAADAVAAEAGAVLGRRPRAWKALVLENVDADAAWWAELSRSSGLGAAPLVDRRTPLPGIRIEGRSWDEYLASRSRNLRSQLGRKQRGLEREHSVSFRWTKGASEVEADMATLFRLHDARWDSRMGHSSLTSERARAFHADFAAEAHRRGWLRLGFLEVDSEPVAAWYGWRLGGRFAYYQAGFDPAWSRQSVGLLLFAQSIRRAIEEGASDYDMLLGGEDFKHRFADSERTVCTAVIAPRLGSTRLLAATEKGARRASGHFPDSMAEPAKRVARSLLERLPMARRR